MLEKSINLHPLFDKIFDYLSKIPFNYLNTFINSYCVIFILVFITLLGLVLFAENRAITVDSYLDTEADLERRINDNNIPLDLAYILVSGPTWTKPHPFLIDRNDSTGVRLKIFFLGKTPTFTKIDGRGGFIYSPRHVSFNDQGELLPSVNIQMFFAVDQWRGVQSRGRPINRLPHSVKPDLLTVLRVTRDV